VVDLARMRREYEHDGLDEADVDPDPIHQFSLWLQVAVDAGLEEPNAMVVSTVDTAGQPWSRFVLLKQAGAEGFDFFTNYGSAKSQHLTATPLGSLCFGWLALRRQVVIAGTVARVPAEESDTYWAVRPRGSQLGGWASTQSRPLSSRQELLDRYAEAERTYPDQVPRPPHWGGWRLTPHTMEFWQGRTNRLHDRLRYTRPPGDDGHDGPWRLTRLAP
jgi:pyridoxamine 5'-phosphate oxidase